MSESGGPVLERVVDSDDGALDAFFFVVIALFLGARRSLCPITPVEH